MALPAYKRLIKNSNLAIIRRRSRGAYPAYGKAGIPYLPKKLQRTGEGSGGYHHRLGVAKPETRKRVPGDQEVHKLLRGRAYTSVARASGLPLGKVMRVLKGIQTEVKINTVVALARGLGCSMEELYRALVTLWTGQESPVEVAVWWGREREKGKGKVPQPAPVPIVRTPPPSMTTSIHRPPQKENPPRPVSVPTATRPSAVMPVETERGFRDRDRPETIQWGGRDLLDEDYFD